MDLLVAHERNAYPGNLATHTLSTLTPTLPPPFSLHFPMCLPLHHFGVSIFLSALSGRILKSENISEE